MYTSLLEIITTIGGNTNFILSALFRDVMIPRWQHTIPKSVGSTHWSVILDRPDSFDYLGTFSKLI